MNNAELIAKYEAKLERTRAALRGARDRESKNAFSAQVNLISEVLKDLKEMKS